MASDLTAHPGVSAVLVALADQGIKPEVRFLPDAVRTAQAAADALGITPAEIANSLVFKGVDVDGAPTPILVLASGGHRVDTAYVAGVLGLAALERADPDFVRAHTGMAIGGVAPVGHPRQLRTLVDTDLAAFEVIWAAAGHSHAVFRTTYAELLAMTGGTACAVVG